MASIESREYLRSVLDRGADLIQREIRLSAIQASIDETSPVLSTEDANLWIRPNSTGNEPRAIPVDFKNWEFLREYNELHYIIFDPTTGKVRVSDEPPEFAQFRLDQILESGPRIQFQSVFLGYTSPSSILLSLQQPPLEPLSLAVFFAENYLPLGDTSLTRVLFALSFYFLFAIILTVYLVDRVFIARIRSLQGVVPYFERFLFNERPLDSDLFPDGGKDEIGTYSRDIFTLIVRTQREILNLRNRIRTLEYKNTTYRSKPQELLSFLGTELVRPVQILGLGSELFDEEIALEERQQLLSTWDVETKKLWSLTNLLRSSNEPTLCVYSLFEAKLKEELLLWSPEVLPSLTFSEAPPLTAYEAPSLVLVHFWRILLRNVLNTAGGVDMTFSLTKISDQDSFSMIRFELRFTSSLEPKDVYPLIEDSGIRTFLDLLGSYEPRVDLRSLSPRTYGVCLDLRVRQMKIPDSSLPTSEDIPPPQVTNPDPVIVSKVLSSNTLVRTEGLHLLKDQAQHYGWLRIEQYATLCAYSGLSQGPYWDELIKLIDTKKDANTLAEEK